MTASGRVKAVLRLLVFSLLAVLVFPEHALAIDLKKVADVATPIPGGTHDFSDVYSPQISSGNIAFGSAFDCNFRCEVEGVYLFNETALSRVADLNTPIPHGKGTFSGIDNVFGISEGSVAFLGYGPGGQRGIYVFDGTTLKRAADRHTVVPGAKGRHFVRFSEPQISGGNVVFVASVSRRENGIYLFNGTTLSRVADWHTAAPDEAGSFAWFSTALISGSYVAFSASVSHGQGGFYLSDGMTLRRVVGHGAPLPGGTGTFSDMASLVGISGSNVVVRDAEDYPGGGIYLFNGTALSRIADHNTPIPDGAGHFSPFVNEDGDPRDTFVLGPHSISGGNVAFLGYGSGGQQGIYLFNGTTLSRLADLNTAIPGGTGTFTWLGGAPQISGGNVVFVGYGSDGQGGIYLFNGTTLSLVADHNTPVPEGTGNFISVYDPQISGGSVVFLGSRSDGTHGIYLFNGADSKNGRGPEHPDP